MSHDVRAFRGHDSAFERVVGEVANSSVEMTFGSGSFMFGQEGAWPAEADLVRGELEVGTHVMSPISRPTNSLIKGPLRCGSARVRLNRKEHQKSNLSNSNYTLNYLHKCKRT